MSNFEVFNNRRAKAVGPTVTIGQRGVFTLSGPAYDLLGRPPAVEFLYDRETRTVGIRGADRESPDAYSVRASGKSFAVSGGAFARYYDIPIGVAGAAWRRDAHLRDGILQVDLNEAPTQVTSNRLKSKEAQ